MDSASRDHFILYLIFIFGFVFLLAAFLLWTLLSIHYHLKRNAYSGHDIDIEVGQEKERRSKWTAEEINGDRRDRNRQDGDEDKDDTAESFLEIVAYHVQSSAISLPSVFLNVASSVAPLPLELYAVQNQKNSVIRQLTDATLHFIVCTFFVSIFNHFEYLTFLGSMSDTFIDIWYIFRCHIHTGTS